MKERSIAWTRFVHHDPLYYIDFPELSKVMANGTNWRDGFQAILGSKEVFLGGLRSLEEIRNKVAHNWRATDLDLRIIRNTHAQIESSLGSERFAALVTRCSNAADARQRLDELRDEAHRCMRVCTACDQLPPRDTWNLVHRSEWLGLVSLDVDFSAVQTFFDLLDEYDRIPGSSPGYRRERWVESNRLVDHYRNADAVLATMITEVMDD